MLHSENEAMQDETGSARKLIQQSHTSTHVLLWGARSVFCEISIGFLIKQDWAHHIMKQQQ